MAKTTQTIFQHNNRDDVKVDYKYGFITIRNSDRSNFESSEVVILENSEIKRINRIINKNKVVN